MKAFDLWQDGATVYSASPANWLAALVTGQRSPSDVPEDQWGEIIPLAVRQRLAPMLLWSVRKAGFEPDPGGIWRPVFQAAQAAALHAALLDQSRQRLSAAFWEAEIPAIWLKGIALGHSVYPELRLRPMVDIDVLVPREKREAARQVAGRLGFHPSKVEYLTILGAPDQVIYHDQLWGGPGRQVCLEVHSHLLGLDGQRLLPEEQVSWFWEQGWDLESDRPGFFVFTPEAHLLYLCAHAVLQHGEGSLNLLRLLDLYWLIKTYELDWQVVAHKAIDLNWAYAVERCLSRVVEVYRAPVPERITTELRAYWEKDAQQIATVQQHSRSVRWDEWRLIFRNLPRGQRFRLVWKTLFPPGPLMRSLYSIPSAKHVLPYYLYRWLDGGREVIRALWMHNKGWWNES